MRKLTVSAVLVLAVASLVVASGCSEDSPSSASNNAPTIVSVTVAPASVNPGGEATVTVVATDPDGDDLSYAYDPSAGDISGSGEEVTWIAPMDVGDHSITVTVTDGNGGEDSDSGSLTVVPLPGTIEGGVVKSPFVPGDVRNGVVSIYTSLGDWVSHQPAMTTDVVGSNSVVGTYSLTDVPPGNYLIDYWWDSDLDLVWSSGDLVAWYGSGHWSDPTLTPFAIAEDEILTIDMQAVRIP